MMWLLIAMLTLISSCYSGKNPDSLDFIVIGDWGGVPYPPYSTDIEQSISRKLMEIANDVKVDFLLALGDNFYYDGVENEFDSRFENSFENVFKASDLFFPWYFIAGNHDWRGNVSAQIAYTKRSNRWNFPNYFYTIEKPFPGAPNKKIAIIMIDTVLLCGKALTDFDEDTNLIPIIDQYLTDAYWTFVKNELVRVKGYAYVIVAGHYPVWSVAEHGPTQCLVEKLDPLLRQFNVTAYINGHDHTIEHIQLPNGPRDSMDYFTIGAANFFSNSKKHHKSIPSSALKFHWMNVKAIGGLALISVTPENLMVEILSTDGDSLYKTNIAPRY